MENFTINRNKKTFVFDDGEEIPIPKDKVTEVLRSPVAKKSKQESYEERKKLAEASPFGDVIETASSNLREGAFGDISGTLENYAKSAYKSFTPGAGQEDMGYVDRLLDHFYAMQEGKKEYLTEQSQRNPKSAMAGQLGGLAMELGLLHNVPAVAALPVIGAAHSEKSILEPTEKIPDLAREATTGLLLDRFFGAANRVAGHRQARRGVQDAIRTAEERNASEVTRAANQTAADAQRFATENATREAEIAGLPARQQAENQQFLNSSNQQFEKVAQSLGNTPIAVESIGVQPFVDEVIGVSANAGSREGNFVTRFLNSLFKGDKNGKITGQNIRKGLQAVDETIAKETGPIKEMLIDFKNYVVNELPPKLGNYFAYEKWMPKIENRLFPALEKDFSTIFKVDNTFIPNLEKSLGNNFVSKMNQSIKKDISEIFKKNSGNFEEALINGTIAQEVEAAIQANPLYQKFNSAVNEYTPNFLQKGAPKDIVYSHNPAYKSIESEVASYPANVADRVVTTYERYLPDIRLDISTKSGVADKSLKSSPLTPNIIPEPPPVSPAQTFQPNLTPVPQIPEPQGVLQRLAYGLEGLTEGGISGAAQAVKDNATTGLLAKMAGVPIGKIAAGTAGVAAGLSALTSPSVMGRAFRSGLEQTVRMIDAVKQRAESYPSHSGNGVLNDPLERRSLVKEIEDDLNMRIEDKALIQSKVNRGQPLISDLKR